jgi:(R,R)-butanediol dehydrogenase/meso-butanediol dehydrogenase/diacetyl reductase
VNASGGGEWVDFGPQLVDLSGEKTEREIVRIRVANEVADFGLGATVLDPNKVDVVAEVRKRTNGAGVDLVLDDAGHSETLTMALQASRIQGRVVEVGIFEKPCTFNINDLVLKERELIGILNTGCMIPTALKLMAAGRVDPTLLISNRIDLEDVVEKGFKECIVHKDTNVKVIVNSNPDLWDT